MHVEFVETRGRINQIRRKFSDSPWSMIKTLHLPVKDRVGSSQRLIDITRNWHWIALECKQKFKVNYYRVQDPDGEPVKDSHGWKLEIDRGKSRYTQPRNYCAKSQSWNAINFELAKLNIGELIILNLVSLSRLCKIAMLRLKIKKQHVQKHW